MRELFGTDGIRGVANTYPMTPEMILKIGRAAAYKIKDSKKRCNVMIGKDTRLSGYMIETSLAAGICSMGVDVLLVGPMPTPGVSYLTRKMGSDAGVVISASHNEYEDNGIKFFSSDGFKLSDAIEAEIERIVFANKIDELRPTATEVGKAYRVDDAGEKYVAYAKSTFPKELALDGLKVVIDCANGAAYKVAPSVFAELNADVVTYMVGPDGKNINRDCGALHTGGMRQLVLKEKADLGIALDGDGDRCVLCDAGGEVVNGDGIMAICAKFLKERNALNKNTLVATVMSNFGLEKFCKEEEITLKRTKVGDRYVVEEMIKEGYNLGGEQSGHVVFMNHNCTGDGIVTALQVLATMKLEGRTLKELAGRLEEIPQVLLAVCVREKRDFEKIPSVRKSIEQAEKGLGDRGRVLVRYSGTELKARVMVEGENEGEIRKYAEDIAQAIKEKIGKE